MSLLSSTGKGVRGQTLAASPLRWINDDLKSLHWLMEMPDHHCYTTSVLLRAGINSPLLCTKWHGATINICDTTNDEPLRWRGCCIGCHFTAVPPRPWILLFVIVWVLFKGLVVSLARMPFLVKRNALIEFSTFTSRIFQTHCFQVLGLSYYMWGLQ